MMNHKAFTHGGHEPTNGNNLYDELLWIFGDSIKLENYINTVLKYDNKNRNLDIYGKQRNALFHAKWMGVNSGLYAALNSTCTQIYENLKHSKYTHETCWETAQAEGELILKQLEQMYQKTCALQQLGWSFDKIIRAVCQNLISRNVGMLDTLMNYIDHPLWGSSYTNRMLIRVFHLGESILRICINQFTKNK